MRTLLATLLPLALAVGLTVPAAATPPEGARRRPAEPGEVRVRRTPPDRPTPAQGADGATDAAPRFGRRPPERGRTSTAPHRERELHIAPRDAHACPLDGRPRLVRRLLALENESQLMSLEVWGDSHEYAPYQEVIYYLRSPRPVFVTLYWVGPDGDVYVPFSNLRIPANRNVSVDPDSIVVPPLGREQWVAIATLEPLPSPCRLSAAELIAVLDRLRRIPNAVGRWEVRSQAEPPAAGPKRDR